MRPPLDKILIVVESELQKLKDKYLNIQILNVLCIFLDEYSSRFNGIPHEDGEEFIR